MARLNLVLTDSNEKLIEKLITLCELKTKTDVIENALLLLAWAAGQTAKGLTIAAIDEERKIYREVQTPALQGATNVAD